MQGYLSRLAQYYVQQYGTAVGLMANAHHVQQLAMTGAMGTIAAQGTSTQHRGGTVPDIPTVPSVYHAPNRGPARAPTAPPPARRGAAWTVNNALELSAHHSRMAQALGAGAHGRRSPASPAARSAPGTRAAAPAPTTPAASGGKAASATQLREAEEATVAVTEGRGGVSIPAGRADALPRFAMHPEAAEGGMDSGDALTLRPVKIERESPDQEKVTVSEADLASEDDDGPVLKRVRADSPEPRAERAASAWDPNRGTQKAAGAPLPRGNAKGAGDETSPELVAVFRVVDAVGEQEGSTAAPTIVVEPQREGATAATVGSQGADNVRATPRYNVMWTEEEDRILREAADLKVDRAAVATKSGRTEGSVEARLSTLSRPEGPRGAQRSSSHHGAPAEAEPAGAMGSKSRGALKKGACRESIVHVEHTFEGGAYATIILNNKKRYRAMLLEDDYVQQQAAASTGGESFFLDVAHASPAPSWSVGANPRGNGAVTSRQRRKKVVAVIGAGLAGLVAAAELEKSGLQVVVLEARDRVGGRVEGVELQVGNRVANVDVGAAHIHGDDRNPVMALAKKAGVDLLPHGQKVMALSDEHGERLSRKTDLKVSRIFEDMLRAAKVYAAQMTRGKPPRAAFFIAMGMKMQRDIDEKTDTSVFVLSPQGVPVPVRLVRSVDGGSFLVSWLSRDIGDAALARYWKGLGIPVSRIGARPVWFREIVARHEAFPADAVLLRVAQSIWRRTGPPNASSAATDDAFAVKVDVSKPCKSLGDFVDMFRELHLSGNKTVTTQEERCFLWQIGNLEYACGTALSNLSIKHWDVDSCAGLSTEQSLVRGGSDKILKPLVDKVGDVRLKFEVTRVEWDASTGRVEGSLPCIVHRADGPPVGADAVVVTLPLGVLKARAVAFDPPLPEEKAAAIGRLGFGNVAKIVLSFEKRFWAPAMGAKRRIGRLPGKAPDGPGIFFEFADVTDATNAPTIVASCGGTFADMMSKELITDERVAETFANSAHIMFKNLCQGCDTPEKPLAWATASWGTDRHFHGCYTYMGLDSSPADVEALRKPLRDGGGNTRLFFAGEATDSRFLASTEGAMRSGIRAADAVAKSLLSSKSYAAWKEVHATPMSDTDSDSEESDADDDGGEEKGSILSLDENHLTSSRVGEEFQVAAPPPSPLAAAAPLKKETQMHVLQQWLESEGIAAPETEAADARWRASPGRELLAHLIPSQLFDEGRGMPDAAAVRTWLGKCHRAEF